MTRNSATEIGHGENVVIDNTAHELVGVREVVQILGWDQRKVSVYYSRGKLPQPIAVLAATPVWYRRQIEQFAKGVTEPNTSVLPEEHCRAILWAHFESSRLGLLSPIGYGDPLPWAVNKKPPGYARALTGLTFATAYNELWPAFLDEILNRKDLANLLQDPIALWEVATKAFSRVRFGWERLRSSEKQS